MSESIEASSVIPSSPQQIYDAWLSSEEHSAFTGDEARIDPVVGGRHSAFGDYIKGLNVQLEPPHRIVQTWRTTEFPADAPDSRLEILLDEVKGGTKVTMLHTGIPDGQAKDYEKGWLDYYIQPMKEYFSK
ncbi:MAG: SRPBCC domain-containing protein [Dehalococcoidia bacterium]|nr:SRPBCC domain-containing protein [Dehalococcoidia bacterium]